MSAQFRRVLLRLFLVVSTTCLGTTLASAYEPSPIDCDWAVGQQTEEKAEFSRIMNAFPGLDGVAVCQDIGRKAIDHISGLKRLNDYNGHEIFRVEKLNRRKVENALGFQPPWTFAALSPSFKVCENIKNCTRRNLAEYFGADGVSYVQLQMVLNNWKRVKHLKLSDVVFAYDDNISARVLTQFAKRKSALNIQFLSGVPYRSSNAKPEHLLVTLGLTDKAKRRFWNITFIVTKTDVYLLDMTLSAY